MPIYEYRCDACGHEMEALQKMSDDALTDCPACGASQLVKQVSAPAFRLAGSGWYETDFKSGNKKQLADGGDSSGGQPGNTSDGGSSDSTKGDSGSKPSSANASKSAASKGSANPSSTKGDSGVKGATSTPSSNS